jgi:hypothetical protein
MIGECEPIKIPQENLVYIPKSTRHAPVLTRSRPRNYRKDTSPRNQVSSLKTQRNMILDTSKVTCETITIKIGSTSNSRSHAHFIEHPA